MQEMGVIKRAFELARTGTYKNYTVIRLALKKEGFTEASIEQHLGGNGIRNELRHVARENAGARSC